MRNGESWKESDLVAAQNAIGYRFHDVGLLKTCFTHKSYSNARGGEDNERLEFLGDAVLELCVTEALYKSSPLNEGRLTELRQQYVSQTALERAEERAGLKRFLRFSGGENNVSGKTASNLFEAVVGAIYLDGGIEEVRAFLTRYLSISESENYKTVLQEYVQERTKKTPVYLVSERNGKYVCSVSALGKKACGEGESKKSAETEAAKKLCRILFKGKKN